ncbi:YagK/YfjJ domain-containing protein [Acinetobacter sp.]|uniref:YagK/YfjJ domain-containing protein n=1 Tax=Acinetobacter sp. TaxID=472 RepID=UPI002FD9C618
MYLSLDAINPSQVSIAIDQFIRSVIHTVMTDQQFKTNLLKLVPLFQRLNQDALNYCQSLRVFQELLDELRKFSHGLFPWSIESLDSTWITHLKSFVVQSRFRIEQEWQVLSLQEKRNRKSLSEYLQRLTQHYAKLLFVRVDLAIELEHQSKVGITQFNDYLRLFLNRVQNHDTCFQDLHGYAWAIEQGESKGYHCHLLLIYDGHKHQNDFGLALQVGQCWREITDNQGCFFTSNAPEYKRQFERRGTLGIGMIHRGDPQQVQNAINAAMYLVNPEKEDQYLRARVNGMRTFGKGRYDVPWRRNRLMNYANTGG